MQKFLTGPVVTSAALRIEQRAAGGRVPRVLAAAADVAENPRNIEAGRQISSARIPGRGRDPASPAHPDPDEEVDRGVGLSRPQPGFRPALLFKNAGWKAGGRLKSLNPLLIRVYARAFALFQLLLRL